VEVGAAESFPPLVEGLQYTGADCLLDEEDVKLLKQVNAYDSLKSKLHVPPKKMYHGYDSNDYYDDDEQYYVDDDSDDYFYHPSD
jgi:hypothetical protein